MKGEKTSGIKLHIGVDTKDFPHSVRVRTVEVSDRDGGIETLRSYAPNLRKWVVERTIGWLEKFRRIWKNC
jgi:hypothetical protein